MVRHRCGYVLLATVVDRLAGKVVVNYRDRQRGLLTVFRCPGCSGELRLWWDARDVDDLSSMARE